MNIKLKIINNHNLSDDEVREEIVLAETRMNSQSKVRFHIEEIPIPDQAERNETEIKEKLGGKYDE